MIAAVVLVLIRTLTLALSFQRRRTNKIIGRERNLVNGGLEGWKGGGESMARKCITRVTLSFSSFFLSSFSSSSPFSRSLSVCLCLSLSVSVPCRFSDFVVGQVPVCPKGCNVPVFSLRNRLAAPKDMIR